MKKLLAIILAVTLLITAAGCSSSSSSNSSNNSSTASSSSGTSSPDASADTVKSKPITINFWNGFTGPDGEILTEYVDKFNETNPYGITIEMDINAQFLQKIAAAFAGGQAPDLILAPSSFKDTYPDYLADMNEIFTATSLKKEDFSGDYIENCSVGSKLFALPYQVTGRYMYWNKDLFKTAGLDPEKGPATYDEWAQFASKITNKDKNIYGSGVPYSQVFTTVHILQRMGGLFIDYDNNKKLTPRFKDNKGYAKFLNWLGGMVKSKDNPLEKDTDSMMKAGQIGITVSGAFLSPALDAAGINYGVAQLPYDEAGAMNPCSIAGLAVTSSASPEAKQAAFKFIEWWFKGDKNTETSGILNWSLTNGYPSFYTPAINDAKYKASPKLAAMTCTDANASSTYLAPKEFTKTFELANEVIENMIESVITSGKDVNKALDDAQTKAESYLK
ncbi:MAG TPA: extracellular solute-binding protein [Clostridia bacterium]|nr:extracellular solute-binding protein [Clostridia bacterium]